MSDANKAALIRAARTGLQSAFGSPLLWVFIQRISEGQVDLDAGLLALVSVVGFFLIGFISYVQNAIEGDRVSYDRG